MTKLRMITVTTTINKELSTKERMQIFHCVCKRNINRGKSEADDNENEKKLQQKEGKQQVTPKIKHAASLSYEYLMRRKR